MKLEIVSVHCSAWLCDPVLHQPHPLSSPGLPLESLQASVLDTTSPCLSASTAGFEAINPVYQLIPCIDFPLLPFHELLFISLFFCPSFLMPDITWQIKYLYAWLCLRLCFQEGVRTPAQRDTLLGFGLKGITSHIHPSPYKLSFLGGRWGLRHDNYYLPLPQISSSIFYFPLSDLSFP